MRTIEALATISEDGVITARGPRSLPTGEHRVVIVLDENRPSDRAKKERGSMAAFRDSLNLPPYPGNSVVEMREKVTS